MGQIQDVSPTRDNPKISDSAAYYQSVTGRMLALACSQDGQTVYTGSFANMWASQDGGQTFGQLTWQQPPQGQFGVPGALGGWCVLDIAVSPADPNIVLALMSRARTGAADGANSDCGIWRSTDGGGSWTPALPFNRTQVAGQLAWALGNSQVVFAAAGDVFKSIDGGASFQSVLSDGSIFHVAVASAVPSAPAPVVYALGLNKMYVSFNGGQNWTLDQGPIPNNVGGAEGLDNSQAPSVMVVSPRSPVEVFLVANSGVGRTLGPAAVVRPFVCDYHNQQHFAYLDNMGTLWDAYWDGDNEQWNLQQLNNGGKTNAPPAALNGALAVSTYKDQQHFAYQDSGGKIWDAFWDGNNWTPQQINMGGQTSAPAAAPGGGPFVSVYKDQQHFVYRTVEGAIWDAYWDSQQWTPQQINLKQIDPWAKADAPAAAPDSGPFVSVYKDQQHFVYRADGGAIWDAYWDGNNWTPQQINLRSQMDPLAKTDAPEAAANGGPFVSVYKDQQHFVYRADGGVIWDAFWNGEKWTKQQINLRSQMDPLAKTDAPEAAANGGPFVSVYKDQQHFVYQADGGVIWDAFWNGEKWTKQQINLRSTNPQANPQAKTNGGAAVKLGGPFISDYHNQQHFAYLAGGGEILDAYWDGDNSQWNLQHINLGPMLWRGDYSHFPVTKQSTWKAVTLPNLGGQDSGNVFLTVTQPGNGDLLFYGPQRSQIFAGPLYPASASEWRALVDTHKVHVDLHGVFLSPDFRAAMQNGNYHFYGGTMWLLSDGGVYRSTDGGINLPPVDGITSLACVNIAGAAIEGQGPVLSLNCGDNDGFFSPNGGGKWFAQDYGGGDNDCSFADPLRPHSMLVFTPRWDKHGNLVAGSDGQTVTVYEAHVGHLPNVALGTNHFHTIPGPPRNPNGGRWNAGSPYVFQGFRPIIRNMDGDADSTPGDYVFLRFKPDATVLLRTRNILGIHHASDWAGAETGPELPPVLFTPAPVGFMVVQASGGHMQPVFYVGDANTQILKWTDGMADWQAIVASPKAGSALRFFVDPYRPDLIYRLDAAQPHIMRSDDGGAHWQVDVNLETQLTCNGAIAMNRDEVIDDTHHNDVVVTDMQFHPTDALTRFAAGFAGVFQTVDGGTTWVRLLDTAALPGLPTNCYWDWISDPNAPSLYAGFAGRSVVKIALS